MNNIITYYSGDNVIFYTNVVSCHNIIYQYSKYPNQSFIK